MRGSPLRQLLVVAAFILISGTLVWSLTRAKTSATPAVQPRPAAERTISLSLELTASSPAVAEFSPWNSGAAKSEITDRIVSTATFAAGEKVDVTFRVRWQDASRPQALRAVVIWDGEAIADQTFWGTGTTEDVLSFTVPNP